MLQPNFFATILCKYVYRFCVSFVSTCLCLHLRHSHPSHILVKYAWCLWIPHSTILSLFRWFWSWDRVIFMTALFLQIYMESALFLVFFYPIVSSSHFNLHGIPQAWFVLFLFPLPFSLSLFLFEYQTSKHIYFTLEFLGLLGRVLCKVWFLVTKLLHSCYYSDLIVTVDLMWTCIIKLCSNLSYSEKI